MNQNRTANRDSISGMLLQKRHIRPVFVAAAVAIAGAGLLGFGASSAEAALLTTEKYTVGSIGRYGEVNIPYGGTFCADVYGSSAARGNKVTIDACHGALNQQFSWNGETIYALGAQVCLDVAGAGSGKAKPRTLVQVWPCNNQVNQRWYFWEGKIVSEVYGPTGFLQKLCLDADASSVGSQLYVNDCPFSLPWQIK